MIWLAPNGKSFGIKIHVATQIFGMGTAPYYQVTTDLGSHWDGERTSKTYQFDSKDMGFNVDVESVAQHQSLSVFVTISDVPALQNSCLSG